MGGGGHRGEEVTKVAFRGGKKFGGAWIVGGRERERLDLGAAFLKEMLLLFPFY